MQGRVLASATAIDTDPILPENPWFNRTKDKAMKSKYSITLLTSKMDDHT